MKTKTKALFLSLTFCAGAFCANRYLPRIETKIERIKVRAPEPSLKDLVVKTAQTYQLDPLFLGSIIAQESRSLRMDVIRFEPSYISEARKVTRNEDEQRMLASSHGLMQVMGLEAHRRGVKWSDLYDREINLDTGGAMLGHCKSLALKKRKTRAEQLAWTCKCYNGGEAWENKSQEVQARVQKYANEVMTRYFEALINSGRV